MRVHGPRQVKVLGALGGARLGQADQALQFQVAVVGEAGMLQQVLVQSRRVRVDRPQQERVRGPEELLVVPPPLAEVDAPPQALLDLGQRALVRLQQGENQFALLCICLCLALPRTIPSA